MKLFILFIPLIPFLLIGIIASCTAALIWYSGLSDKDKELANREAFRLFGKKFKDLAEDEQEKIKRNLS